MKVQTETEIVVQSQTELKIRELVGEEKSLTMYRASVVMSEVLGRRIREQMLYNYRAKKLIKVGDDGRVAIDVFVKFVEKRVEKSEK